MSFEETLQQIKPNAAAGTVAAIGTYDGVHIAHQSILSQMAGMRVAERLSSVLFVFRQSPASLLGADKKFRCIYPTDVRLSLIKRANIDHVVTIDFDHALRAKSAEQFFDLLIKELNLKVFIIGHQATVGSDRADAVRMNEILSVRGVRLVSIPPVRSADGQFIHSSGIRDAIAAGEMRKAAEMLGRRFCMTGTVVTGEQYGRKIGFPTANLSFDPSVVVPKDGVYSTYLHIDGQRYVSATSVGVRPTVSTTGIRTVETHITDFDRDIYGESVTIEFVERIRDELKLDSEAELVAWIARDVEYVRASLTAQ